MCFYLHTIELGQTGTSLHEVPENNPIRFCWIRSKKWYIVPSLINRDTMCFFVYMTHRKKTCMLHCLCHTCGPVCVMNPLTRTMQFCLHDICPAELPNLGRFTWGVIQSNFVEYPGCHVMSFCLHSSQKEEICVRSGTLDLWPGSIKWMKAGLIFKCSHCFNIFRRALMGQLWRFSLLYYDITKSI